jgi:hypothetical protein
VDQIPPSMCKLMYEATVVIRRYFSSHSHPIKTSVEFVPPKEETTVEGGTSSDVLDGEMVSERDAVTWSVGSLFFLRYFVPLISSFSPPHLLSVHSEAERKGGVIIAKILMKMASESTFTEEKYVHLNPLLKDLSPQYLLFCDGIMNVGQMCGDVSFHEWQSPHLTDDEIDARSLLYDYLSSHESFIKSFIQSRAKIECITFEEGKSISHLIHLLKNELSDSFVGTSLFTKSSQKIKALVDG